MTTRIFKDFSFDSAHFLPNLPKNHKCRRMHGHTFHVRLTVAGSLSDPEGWVIDFANIKKIFKPVLDELDHRILNEIPGLENPTSEILAAWIWNRIIGSLPGLESVEIRETCTSGCIYSR